MNQLFVAAGGIVTLSSPILIENKDLRLLPPCARHDLLATTAVAMISLGCGFVQLFIERSYFYKNKDANSKIVKLISQGQVKDINHLMELFSELERFPARSSDFFAKVQFVTLTLASFGFVGVMGYILWTAN